MNDKVPDFTHGSALSPDANEVVASAFELAWQRVRAAERNRIADVCIARAEIAGFILRAAQGGEKDPDIIAAQAASEWIGRMQAYRFFRLDADHHIHRPPEILEFRDDAAAIQHAAQIADGSAVEVWDRGRLVAHLERSYPSPQPDAGSAKA